MAKKQAIVKETAAAAAPARAAKPKTPRVTAAKHSKATSVEVPVIQAETAAAVIQNPHDAIALIAYSYWESRGYQDGMHVEDWLRAEQEYAQKTA